MAATETKGKVMLKDFLKAYTVAVLVATIITTALWVVGADSTTLQLAIGMSLVIGVPLSIAYAINMNDRF